MGTLRKFSCEHCGKTLYVSLPLLSPQRTCSGCQRIVAVPETLAEVSAGSAGPGAAGNRETILLGTPPVKTKSQTLASAFRLLGWGTIVYLVGIDMVSSGGAVLQTRFIGDILILVATVRMFRLRLQQALVISLIVLVTVQLLGRLAQQFGVGFAALEPVITLLMIITLYQFARRIAVLHEYRTLLITALVCASAGLAILVLAFVSVGIMLAIHTFLTELPLLAMLGPLVGLLPMFIANVLATIFTTWACFSMARRIENEGDVFAPVVPSPDPPPPASSTLPA